MTGPIRRFDPSELAGGGDPEPSTAELADALAVARELESLTAEPGIRPTAGFEDRVMAAIAAEPAPRLVIRPGSAVRGGRAGALLLAIRDSWGIATTGGRPMAMRAQALAFVFLAVVAVGALTGVGAMTVGSLLGRGPVPSPTIAPGPTIEPSASPSGLPSGSPSPSGPVPSTSPGPSDSPEPGETASPTATTRPGQTARPGETPRPTETPKPGETPRPTRTPRPTETPKPGETPRGNG